MEAMLIGFKEITSQKGEFTIAYLVYQQDEVTGQACKDAFLKGHNLKKEMVGKPVNVEFDIANGRILGLVAA